MKKGNDETTYGNQNGNEEYAFAMNSHFKRSVEVSGYR